MADHKVYKVVVVGPGKRGMHHAKFFKNNPRFELAGISGRDPEKLAKAAAELGVKRTSTDPVALSREVEPDVFCFCTPPGLRLNLIRIGIQSGARLIAYEKPMATSMNEAIEIRKATESAGVKTVVSHQHRYGQHYRKVKAIVESGAIGRVHTVYGHSVGWMLQIFTHLADYIRWYNDNSPAEWVMGQAAGRAKLTDSHPSPDYLAGFVQFANGVRGVLECGAGAPDVPEVDYWWRKNRIGAQGTEGFAEVLTGGGWRAVTRNEKGVVSGEGCMNYDLDMPPYIEDIARWLDDDRAVHPCNGESAYQGFEIMMGLLRSVVQRGQIALPLGPGEPELEALAKILPPAPVLSSTEANRKNYRT
ncbi:MAG TPA: Gfo/Idh/MocA family oxidoreductase [Terriglobia bacterium]|nr:Gfo/Idh/MocA family oxidoreductase [Terriglobia bacterium]